MVDGLGSVDLESIEIILVAAVFADPLAHPGRITASSSGAKDNIEVNLLIHRVRIVSVSNR